MEKKKVTIYPNPFFLSSSIDPYITQIQNQPYLQSHSPAPPVPPIPALALSFFPFSLALPPLPIKNPAAGATSPPTQGTTDSHPAS